ncbi:MAG TPA: AAA family ATPase [Candidatus Limnocylindrales bacterium]|nr:AAA family ATPase [Candidatus Limnocylindrales bacterium]
MDSPRRGGARLAAAGAVVGRAGEREAIERFLDRQAPSFRSFHLVGPPGIGKTTLWLASVERARELGWRVLTSRPTDSERQLSFSGLVDLFAAIVDEAAPSLPEPQRVAVDAALLRAVADRPPQPLAVSLGVLGLVRAAAAEGPLALAVDDVQWLDEATSRTLEFVIRRLDSEPVAFLTAERATDAESPLPALVAAAPVDRRTLLRVAPLGVDETGRLIEAALGLQLRRPRLVRVHGLSGGNPFFALEIARAIERGRSAADGMPAVPASLEDLVRERIGQLPSAGREVALHAAALSAPTRPLIRAAVGDAAAADGLEAGVAAGVLVVDGDAVRFSHPLLRAAVYDAASPSERVAAHRTIAAVVDDLEEHARHLALAADRPDADVATALDAAAAAAHARGAPVAAAELIEESVRLTPVEAALECRRRRRTAADYHLAAGDVPRARALLEELLDETAGAERGEVLVQLGLVLMYIGERLTAADRYREALPLVADRPAVRARAEMGLAGVSWLTGRDMDAGAAHIGNALGIAETLGEPTLLLQAFGHAATWHFHRGRGVPRDLMRRAAQLDRWRSHLPAVERPDHHFAKVLGAVGEYDEARRLQDRLIDEARRAGDWNSLPWLHLASAWIELAAGCLGAARTHIEETRTTAVQSGQVAGTAYALAGESRLLALSGDASGCREAAERAAVEGRRFDSIHIAWEVATSLALLELSLGNPAAALEHVAPLLPAYLRLVEPAQWRLLGATLVEALVGVGSLEEADSALDRTERLLRRRSRPLVAADVAALRAQLLAARGELDRAIESAEVAVGRYHDFGLSFERSRALLALGELFRRSRRKAPAAEALRAAVAGFEEVGAGVWADRARAELARTATRRTPGEELTETERRVADLVALGHTNREIATRLFMSVHTVEAHLTRIYRTMGVQTRTELTRRLLERPG